MTTPVTLERDGNSVVLRIPMSLKKRGGRKEIIVPEGPGQALAVKSAAQKPIVTALARAFHWQDLIDSGSYPSIAALAAALEVDRSYVRRILSLACVAPDIVQAIINGMEPSGLSLERLAKGVLLRWEEQRDLLGFASRP